MSKALIGAGCFWSVEEYFRKLKGVKKTSVGYSGGNLDNPTYKDVCTGKTEHAEVVLVEYDEAQLSYTELLNHFWGCHDPTQINKQGFDIGTQYRSVIFYYLLILFLMQNQILISGKIVKKHIKTSLTMVLKLKHMIQVH